MNSFFSKCKFLNKFKCKKCNIFIFHFHVITLYLSHGMPVDYRLQIHFNHLTQIIVYFFRIFFSGLFKQDNLSEICGNNSSGKVLKTCGFSTLFSCWIFRFGLLSTQGTRELPKEYPKNTQRIHKESSFLHLFPYFICYPEIRIKK